MTVFEIFQMYHALKLHFTQESYDYFLYSGKTKVNAKTLEKSKDLFRFKKIMHYRNPDKYLIGNFILNPSTWLGAFDDEFKLTYESYLKNGPQIFESEIKKLNSDFNSNFTVDDSRSIPYIISLMRGGEVSIFTLCVFNQILHLHDKWKVKPQFLIFDKASTKMSKSTPFFYLDSTKYKALIIEHFKP